MLLQLQDLYEEDLNNIDLDELDQIDPEVDQDLEVDPENLNNEVVCLFCCSMSCFLNHIYLIPNIYTKLFFFLQIQ